MTTILLVEDERNLSRVIREALEEDGYGVLVALDGPSGLEAALGRAVDLVVLDLMLPGLDGLEVCRRLRQQSIVPVLMLTARAEEIDRVLGLELGADDYLTKPFAMRELKARVRALLRRVDMMRSSAGQAPTEVVVAAGLRLDPAGLDATLDGAPLDLTPREFALLYLLVRHPGRVFSREYLLDRVWGYQASPVDRTVDTHVYRLRQKLGAGASIARRIVAVRGIGYKLERD